MVVNVYVSSSVTLGKLTELVPPGTVGRQLTELHSGAAILAWVMATISQHNKEFVSGLIVEIITAAQIYCARVIRVRISSADFYVSWCK